MAVFAASASRAARHFSYVPLLAFAASLALVKALAYARLLDVEPFGVLNKMLLVSMAFGIVGSLGMQAVASRDMPALLARGRGRRAFQLLSRTLGITTLFGAVLAAAALTGLSPLALGRSEMALAVLHGWAQSVFLIVAFETRSRLEMQRYAIDLAVRAVAVLVGGSAVAALGGAPWMVITVELLATLAMAGQMAAAAVRRMTLPWAFLLRSARVGSSMPWRSALVMLAGTSVAFASATLDRWIGAHSLDIASFGRYSLAALALVVAQSVQSLVNAGVLPLLARRRATGLAHTARRITTLLSMTGIVAGLVGVWPMAWLLAHAVQAWFPAYAEVTPLLLPLLIAAVLRMSDFWGSLAIVEGREGRLLVAQFASTAIVACVYWIVSHGMPPSAKALAWLAVALAASSYVGSLTALRGKRGPW